MTRLRKSEQPWLLILLLAVLATRLGGVHLHLCFDGQEPPATIHVEDGGAHNDAHHVDTHHTDKDVQMFDAVPVKKGNAFDLPVLFVACLLLALLVSPTSGRWSRAAFQPIFPLRLAWLRPPLRGPPL